MVREKLDPSKFLTIGVLIWRSCKVDLRFQGDEAIIVLLHEKVIRRKHNVFLVLL